MAISKGGGKAGGDQPKDDGNKAPITRRNDPAHRDDKATDHGQNYDPNRPHVDK